MPISPVNNIAIQNKPASKGTIVRDTGYAAVGFAIASGVAVKYKSIKWHKYFGYAAGVLTLAHIAIIEWFNYKRRSNKKSEG